MGVIKELYDINERQIINTILILRTSVSFKIQFCLRKSNSLVGHRIHFMGAFATSVSSSLQTLLLLCAHSSN